MEKLEILEGLFQAAGKGAMRFAEVFSDLWIETRIKIQSHSVVLRYEVYASEEDHWFTIRRMWSRSELEQRIALEETIAEEIGEMIASLSAGAVAYYQDKAEEK